MKKIVLMLAAVLAVSSVSFANNHEAKKDKKEHVDCKKHENAEKPECKAHH